LCKSIDEFNLSTENTNAALKNLIICYTGSSDVQVCKDEVNVATKTQFAADKAREDALDNFFKAQDEFFEAFFNYLDCLKRNSLYDIDF